jgi:hypothetical protein
MEQIGTSQKAGFLYIREVIIIFNKLLCKIFGHNFELEKIDENQWTKVKYYWNRCERCRESNLNIYYKNNRGDC